MRSVPPRRSHAGGTAAKFLRWLVRVSGGTVILVLPMGYYPDNPDSSNLMVGVHGGGGQIMSVVRDCSGKPLAQTNNTYTDVAGSAFIALGRSPVTLGARWGYFESDALPATTYATNLSRHRVHFSYFNPTVGFESRMVGLGVGPVLGHVPTELDDLFDNGFDEVPISGHLRLGDINQVYFMSSLAENTPLISGGSWFDIGMGYVAGESYRGFTGVSLGMYDRAAILQQNRIKVHRNIDVDLALRAWGGALGGIEGGASVGLVYRFGAKGHRRGAHAEPPPEPDWGFPEP